MHDLFRHEAMPYAGRARFAATTVSIVRGSLERGEHVIVLAAGEKVDDVRDELGDEADDVTFVPTDEHGVNESVAVGRSRAAQLEAQYADSVLNAPSLRTSPLSVVCLDDAATLGVSSLDAMRRGHAVVRGYIEDPLAGRFAPPATATATSGCGLWLANDLCDLVQLRSTPGRTVVRMYVDR